jgi:hypothetical protein
MGLARLARFQFLPRQTLLSPIRGFAASLLFCATLGLKRMSHAKAARGTHSPSRRFASTVTLRLACVLLLFVLHMDFQFFPSVVFGT